MENAFLNDEKRSSHNAILLKSRLTLVLSLAPLDFMEVYTMNYICSC